MDTKIFGEFIKRGTAIGNTFNDLVNEVRGLGQLVLDTVLETSVPAEQASTKYNSLHQIVNLPEGSRLRPDESKPLYEYLREEGLWSQVFVGTNTGTGAYYDSKRLLTLFGQYVLV